MKENMRKTNILKLAIFTAAVLGLGFFAFSSEAQAETYYASPAGSGSSCSNVLPCAPNEAINNRANPGDTIILKAGNYTESRHMLFITNSGTPSSPITIKGENDDTSPYGINVPVFDGNMALEPCKIFEADWIDISGIVCQNSKKHGFWISHGDHINVRRLSAYNANDNSTEALLVYISESNNILIEDAAATGPGKKAFQAISSDNIIFRRVWGRTTRYNYSQTVSSLSIMAFYKASNSIFENAIAYNATTNWHLYRGIECHDNEFGGLIHSCVSNSFYGNVVYGGVHQGAFHVESSWTEAQQHDNYFKDNVSINNTIGYRLFEGDPVTIKNATVVGSKDGWNGVNSAALYCSPIMAKASIVNATVKNSVFLNNDGGLNKSAYCQSLTNTYNDFYNNIPHGNYIDRAAKGMGEIFDQPNYDPATFGKGAYLMKPSNLAISGEGGTYMGAEVLYKYQDGTLTEIPLWPWPMEARICAETGYSVTYENPTNCKQNGTNASYGGGIWKYSVNLWDEVYSAPNSPNVDGSGSVNIKDIQICIKGIIDSTSISSAQLEKCQAVAPPIEVVNIKDIQAIIKAIIT